MGIGSARLKHEEGFVVNLCVVGLIWLHQIQIHVFISFNFIFYSLISLLEVLSNSELSFFVCPSLCLF